MTHGSEEAAFAHVGAVSLRASIFECLLVLFARAYVAEHSHDFAAIIVGRIRRRLLKRPATHFDPDVLRDSAPSCIDPIAANTELDRAALSQRSGIAERGQVRRAIRNMDTVEQPVILESADRQAE